MKRLLVILVGISLYGKPYHETYRVNRHVKEKLDAHSGLLAKKLKQVHQGTQKHGVWQFDWLQGYYIKYGLARIEGMEKMQKVIDRCNLSSITVADKRVYRIKGTDIKGTDRKPSNRNCAIVIKRVKAENNLAPVTLDEVQQLCTIMHETGYISMTGPLAKKGPNYIRTKDGSFCLIDTESRYDHTNLLKGFIRLLQSHDYTRDLSEEALKHILWEVEQLLKEKPEEIRYTIRALKICLKEQSGVPTWDYKSYIKNFCKQLKENQ